MQTLRLLEKYVDQDNWTITARTTTDFKSKLSVQLREITGDGGTNREPTNLDSTYFTVDLPFGFPNRQSSSEYKDGAWKLVSFSISTDCGESATTDIAYSSFVSRLIIMILLSKQIKQ